MTYNNNMQNMTYKCVPIVVIEHKSLVTVGSSSLDTEQLDEINLNASTEDSVSSETSDANANPLLEQPISSDSILSQAASSFSALPSVASNVFSSFSKRITAISSRETTPSNDQDPNGNFVPQLDIQPPYTQHQQYQQGPPPAAEPFYAPPPPQAGGNYYGSVPPSSSAGLEETQFNLPPSEPPKFYSPGEVPAASVPAIPPPTAGGQNSFRFSAKKKLYAPIPGLSDQNQQPAAAPTFQQPSAVSAPISYDNSYGGGYPTNDPYGQQQQAPYPSEERKSEERKTSGGLFSKFTNLAPTGVLQNITGLVQSAAGTLTQTIKPESTEQTPAPNYGITFESQQQTGYFAGVPPPPVANYFAAPHLGEQQANYPPPPPATAEFPQSTAPPPAAVSFFNPQDAGSALPQAFLPPTQPKTAAVNFFDPSAAPAVFDPFNPHLNTSEPARPPRPSSRPVNSFSETVHQAAPLATPPISTSPPQSSQPSGPPPQLQPTAEQPPVALFNPFQINSGVPPATATPTPPPPQVGLFDPTKYLPNSSTTPPQTGVQPTLPPTAGSALPPPPGGQTSYRLQKGTKLYKNPLTAQETAPVQVTPNPTFAAPPPSFAPTPFGVNPNVFAQAPVPAATSQGVFPDPFGQSVKPPGLTPVANIFVPSAEAQSVALFAPPPEPTKVEDLRTNESVPLFAQPSEHVNSETVPLFAAPTPGVPLFEAPAGSETKVEEQIQAAPEEQIQTSGSEQINPVEPQLPTQEEQAATTTEATNSAYFFQPIEPVSEQVASGSANFFGSNEQFFQPIEPVVETPKAVPETSATQLTAADPLEQTLQHLSLSATTEPPTTAAEAQASLPQLPPPSLQGGPGGSSNPYRRGSISESSKPPSAVQPTLANFFTPAASSGAGDFNFFSSLPAAETNIVQQSSTTVPNPATNFFSSPSLAGDISQSFFNQTTQASHQNQALNFFAPPPAVGEIKAEPTPQQAIGTSTGFFASTDSENKSAAFLGNPSEVPTQQPSVAELTTPTTPYPSEVSPQQTTNPALFPPLPTNIGIIPSVSESKETINKHQTEDAAITSTHVPPAAIGFENFMQTPTQPSATSFFAPVETENKPQPSLITPYPTEVPPQQQTAAPPTSLFSPLPTNFGTESAENINKPQTEETVPPPIGFDSFMPTPSQAPSLATLPPVAPEHTTQQQTSTVTQQTPQQQNEIVNSFSNFFNPTSTTGPTEVAKDPSSFFDSFAGQAQPVKTTNASANPQVANEDQLIQNFFNNPPPKDADHAGDLNYDLVHSGLAIRNLQQRSLTPVSNLVEPPCSSACSEFSTVTASETSIIKEDSKAEGSAAAIVDPLIKHYEELPEEILKELRMANVLQGDKAPTASTSYKPAVKHWFYKSTVDGKQVWVPFSHYDSALLETSLVMEGDNKPELVAVEGGRYDVNIDQRLKRSVYWESEPIEVRRCSWFYKAVDSKYIPYEESTADVLEAEYKQAAESGVWHKTIILGMGEQVVFHGPTVIVHFQQQQNQDTWGGTTQTTTRPRVVKRDLSDFNIAQGESQKVDHLLFMVHGIGSGCDLKLRSVEEVVEDFRSIAHQLVQSHYKNSSDLGLVGRVEVLPISWHSHLHSAELGIDEKLRSITLESIPKLRNFTNDTLLDILFYTSPTFCQKIMNSIVMSLNDIYLKYRQRHPDFNGGVSVAGHSLGSLILFDLLCHQHPIKESEEKNLENPDVQFLTATTAQGQQQLDSNQMDSKSTSYTNGPAGTGQPFINYGQLIFQPKKFFALGSPIGMFVTIRGIDKLGLDFRLPTCPGFYNIFHPYDPVAYRIEALVNPDLSGVRPVLIPHHKGRKRMHLELKETMARVSMDLKNRFLDKFKNTFDSVNIFSTSAKSKQETEELMEKEVEKVIEMQMQLERQGSSQQTQSQTQSPNQISPSDEQNQQLAVPPATTGTQQLRTRTDSVSTAVSDDMAEVDFPLGKLNDSKRIDHVLQEAPLEFINEYIFALSSHVCYWDSEDTILFVMKEIYSGLGISPDSQVPQQTMTIERPSSRNSLSNP